MDLCSNMAPGEGLLVGSFARGLFLVHSECAESAYINSRPFRVNAGPVRKCILFDVRASFYRIQKRVLKCKLVSAGQDPLG